MEPRVYVRAARPDDAPLLAASAARSRDLHGPWTSPPITAAGWRARIARQSDRLLIELGCRHEDDAVVGLVTLSEIVRGLFCSAYLGYEAFVPYAGRGYMTESLRLVVDLAFTQLGLHRLEANIQPRNLRSLALARRLGFRKEGFSPRYLFSGGAWRDHERWAITVEEWDRAGSRHPKAQNSRSSPESRPRNSS